jgi:hypothetical protein
MRMLIRSVHISGSLEECCSCLAFCAEGLERDKLDNFLSMLKEGLTERSRDVECSEEELRHQFGGRVEKGSPNKRLQMSVTAVCNFGCNLSHNVSCCMRVGCPSLWAATPSEAKR